MVEKTQSKFAAGSVSIVVRHELWDGNVQDHADQGVAITVVGDVGGTETTLLRFNCFDIEKSYVYGPEGRNKTYRMDPTVDGNPISWTINHLKTNLTVLLNEAGYGELAASADQDAIAKQATEIESTARQLFTNDRNTVKHNRGTDIFEAGNFRFGLELRKQRGGDGGLAIHVLADLAGTPGKTYVEETEMLAFDCFRQDPHYHYGPRNKNHRIFWDKALVTDTLEWTLEQFNSGRLRDMIQRAGYPGIAADYDQRVVNDIFPALANRAREMQGQPLPEEPTPNLVPN